MQLRSLVARFLGRDVARLEQRDPAVITLISVVFSTAPKTFAGSASYVTATAGQPVAQTDDPDDDSPTSSSKATKSGLVLSTSSRSSATSTRSSLSSSTPSTLRTAVSSSTATVASNTATASPAAASGMSGGAKAGIAFGVIILVAVIAGFILFLFQKRKNKHEEHQRLDDEKSFLAGGSNPNNTLPSQPAPMVAASVPRTGTFEPRTGTYEPRTASFESPTAAFEPLPTPVMRLSNETAPQLSLRAVSQFEPSLGDAASVRHAPNMPPNATTAIAAAGAAGLVGAGMAAKHSNTNSNDINNPFGTHAEKLSSSPPQDIPLPASPTLASVPTPKDIEAADFPLPESVPGTPGFPPPRQADVPASLVAGGSGAGAAAIAAATAAAASNKPQGAAPAPGGPVTDNVHRVQLDFKPSMEDELEILAGQLVRVLHEYDDGWALCIRMDRSHQGVVPRTCLSKHPVKPRPSSPSRPRGPPVRGAAPPFGNPPRPHSPGGVGSAPGSPLPYSSRPHTPTGRMSPAQGRMSPAPYAQAPRPLTPTGQRSRANSSASPYVPYQPGRSQSPAPNGGGAAGSRLKHGESSIPRPRANSTTSQVNGTGNGNGSGLRNENNNNGGSPPSKIPAPVGAVPSRKPVPGSTSSVSSPGSSGATSSSS